MRAIANLLESWLLEQGHATMMQKMDAITIINRFSEAFVPIIHAGDVWLQGVIHDCTTQLPWLRNDMFSILIFAYAEGVINYRNVRGNILAEAKKLDLPLMSEYASYIDTLTDELEKLLTIFNADEMAFLNYMRHQNVHGKWTMSKNEKRKVVVSERGRLAMHHFENQAYLENGRIFVEADHHKTVGDLRNKFSQTKSLFWLLNWAIGQGLKAGLMQKEMADRSLKRFRIDGLENPNENTLLTLEEFKMIADSGEDFWKVVRV